MNLFEPGYNLNNQAGIVRNASPRSTPSDKFMADPACAIGY
jgi:hypothetical protein